MDLMLITQSYPFAAEHTFLNQEIPFLVKSFNRVYIIPKNATGSRIELTFKSVFIEEGFSCFINKETKEKVPKTIFFNVGFWKIIIKEVIQKPSNLFNLKKALMMLRYLKNSVLSFLWFKDFIIKKEFNVSQCVFYTYWFTSTTFGLTMLKREFPELKIITRAHNIDLYEERHNYNYIPFRKLMIKKIDAIFPCMQAGSEYLNKKYNFSSKKIKTSYLGVDDHGIVNQPSSDGVLRIVSCSNIIELKRLHLIISGIKELTKSNPEKKIDWVHFGDGELRMKIENKANELISKMVSVKIMGYVPLVQIIKHYKNKPVDVFINVSSYEGQPVSIKEAISFGIPIIATDVGGNSEIVTKGNGILLSANPSPIDIANAINWFTENQDIVKTMRVNSRRLFLEKYDSSVVYPGFIKMILSD